MKLKKLQEKLNYGEIVIFKAGDDTFIAGDDTFIAIGGAGTDEEGCYRFSGRWETKERCLNYIGDLCGYAEEELKKYLPDWEYIESIPLSQKRIPAGTMVTISDNAEEACEEMGIYWNKKMKEMIGKTCEIRENYNSDYRIYNEDKSENWLFPRNAFIIATEEEADEEVIIKISKSSLQELKDSGIKIIK